MVQRLKSPLQNVKVSPYMATAQTMEMLSASASKQDQHQYLFESWKGFLSKNEIKHSIALVESHDDHVSETETLIINDIVKYIAFSLNYFLPSPRKIRFDKKSRRFFIDKTSWIRLATSAAIQSVIFARLIQKISPLSDENPHGTSSSIKRFTYFSFLLYCAICFKPIWLETKNYVKILNHAIDLSSKLALKTISIPRPRLVRYAALASWSFPVVFCSCAHLFPGISAIAFHIIRDRNNLPPIFGNENVTDARFSMNEFTFDMPLHVKVFLIVANFLNTFVWMASFLHTGLWALVFRQLFTTFLWRFEIVQQMDLANEIRTFNSIANLVDQMNDSNGALILGGSFIAILYISTSIEQAFSGVSTLVQLSYKIYLYSSYVPIIAAILMVSDLHRVASSFGNRIKHHFGKWKEVTSSSRFLNSSSMIEALHGINIMYHDIVTSNIGFKGYGFFTITYKFVATMLSLTVTYTLTAIQMFPKMQT